MRSVSGKWELLHLVVVEAQEVAAEVWEEHQAVDMEVADIQLEDQVRRRELEDRHRLHERAVV